MPVAPLPENESLRLKAVARARMVGTPAEERFDRIVRIAKRSFKVQYAMIDFITEHGVWLKAIEGADIVLAPRKNSYCQYTILSGETCLIHDARTDPRTCDLPWRNQHVFYAGVALVFDGQRVGSFCIADGKPREFGDEEKALLRELASLVEHELAVTKLSEAQHALASENEELARAAHIDALTHVWNRGGINEIAARELEASRIEMTSLGFLMLDVDHFKRINDSYGHPGGDAVLREVAFRLRQGVRPTDAVGRYGGEEFLVLLPNAAPEEALSVAERIRTNIAGTLFDVGGAEITVTISAGCTATAHGAAFVSIPVKAADEALYRAKKEGRNCVRAKWLTPSYVMKAPR